MNKGIWVIADVLDGDASRVTWEMLGEARRLGGPVTCVLVGAGVSKLAEKAAHYGADRVLVADDERLAPYNPDAVVATLAPVLEDRRPDAVLFAASTHGREIAPRLATRLGVGLAGECIGFSLEGGDLKAVRPMYAGKVRVTVGFSEDRPRMATVRPNVLDMPQPDPSRSAEREQLEAVIPESRLEVLEVESREEGATVSLAEARIIVSGGRGLKGPENFHLIHELAEALGGAVGASRMVVDAGWKPHSYQVGQTGRVVNPDLYIACGISGAIQHLVGMQGSKCIVAINSNPEANIFKVADYGIVDDLFQVVPELTRQLKGEPVKA